MSSRSSCSAAGPAGAGPARGRASDLRTTSPRPCGSRTGNNPALAQTPGPRLQRDKYRGLPGQGLFAVGLVFDRQARNLVQADWVAVS